MDIATQPAGTRTWALDHDRGVAAREAAVQSMALLEALVVREQDDLLTRALLPRLHDLAFVIVRALDNQTPADELLERVWGPNPAIPD